MTVGAKEGDLEEALATDVVVRDVVNLGRHRGLITTELAPVPSEQ
jgi:hypothetical protein